MLPPITSLVINQLSCWSIEYHHLCWLCWCSGINLFFYFFAFFYIIAFRFQIIAYMFKVNRKKKQCIDKNYFAFSRKILHLTCWGYQWKIPVGGVKIAGIPGDIHKFEEKIRRYPESSLQKNPEIPVGRW